MKKSKYAIPFIMMSFATATTAAPNNPNHTTKAQLDAFIAAAHDYSDSVRDTLSTEINNNTTNASSNRSRIDSNLNRITSLEQRAAVTNARPIPYKVGDTALGFGLGTAGGQQAIAIGVGYRVNEAFSTSATISAETADSMTSDNVSAGAGLQFSF